MTISDKRGQKITKRNVLLEMYLWSSFLFNECYEKLAYLERFHYDWSDSALEILGQQGWCGNHHYGSSYFRGLSFASPHSSRGFHFSVSQSPEAPSNTDDTSFSFLVEKAVGLGNQRG